MRNVLLLKGDPFPITSRSNTLQVMVASYLGRSAIPVSKCMIFSPYHGTLRRVALPIGRFSAGLNVHQITNGSAVTFRNEISSASLPSVKDDGGACEMLGSTLVLIVACFALACTGCTI
jgi:hypothetical protein